MRRVIDIQDGEAMLLTEVAIAMAFCLEAAFIFFTERKEQGRPMPFCVPS